MSQLPQLGHTTLSSLRKGQGPRSGCCPVPPSSTASHCRSLSIDFSNVLLAGQPCSPKHQAGRGRGLSPGCRGGIGEGLHPVTRSLSTPRGPWQGHVVVTAHDLFSFGSLSGWVQGAHSHQACWVGGWRRGCEHRLGQGPVALAAPEYAAPGVLFPLWSVQPVTPRAAGPGLCLWPGVYVCV